MKLSLNETSLKKIPSIADEDGMSRPAYFWDQQMKGLGVRLNRDGSIVWIMRMRVGGGDQWHTLGLHPEMKHKEAREAVEAMRVRIRSGASPKTDKLQARFWEQAVDRYQAEYLPNLKPTTQSSYRSAIRLHIRGAFPSTLVHEIDEVMVRNFHQALGASGITRQANVCLKLIGQIFDHCEAWRYRPLNSNPVTLLKKSRYKLFREESRDRPLRDDELIRLGEALTQMEAKGYTQFCSFVRVLYFSGARRGEVLGLAWDWIDVERKIIRWPDSKTGATSKPLSDALFEVLAGIPRIVGVPWVFPTLGSKSKSKSGHLEDIKRPWKMLLKLAGIENLTRHDLRHNMGNVAADEGENLQTVAALPGHRQTSTTERYSKTKGLAASNRLGPILKAKLKGAK